MKVRIRSITDCVALHSPTGLRQDINICPFSLLNVTVATSSTVQQFEITVWIQAGSGRTDLHIGAINSNLGSLPPQISSSPEW